MSGDIIVHPNARVGRFSCHLGQVMRHGVVEHLAVPDSFHRGVTDVRSKIQNEILLHPLVVCVREYIVDCINGSERILKFPGIVLFP